MLPYPEDPRGLNEFREASSYPFSVTDLDITQDFVAETGVLAFLRLN